MCIYMDCIVYRQRLRRGGIWIIKDELNGKIIGRYSDYEFRKVDHLEVIRQYRQKAIDKDSGL